MTAAMPLSPPLLWLIGAAAGAVLGAVYFTLLRRTARLHAEAGPASTIAGLYGLRIALAVVVFWAVAHLGALPLLLALAGFLAVRVAVRRRVEAQEPGR